MLLDAVDAHGSINQGAKEVGISYRKAWSHIKAMEDRLGFRLVERRTGGRNGGGAVLTGEAKTLIRRFSGLESEVRRIVDGKFRDLFTGGRHV